MINRSEVIKSVLETKGLEAYEELKKENKKHYTDTEKKLFLLGVSKGASIGVDIYLLNQKIRKVLNDSYRGEGEQ